MVHAYISIEKSSSIILCLLFKLLVPSILFRISVLSAEVQSYLTTQENSPNLPLYILLLSSCPARTPNMHAPPNYNNTIARQYSEKVAAQGQPRLAPTTASATPRPPPPPRYTPAAIPQDTDTSHDYDDYDEFDDHDDYNDYDDTADYYTAAKPVSLAPPTPQANSDSGSRTITITLDASISIHGDGNTLTVASRSGSGTEQSRPDTTSPNQYPQKPQSKLANTTAAIVTALQQSGVLSQNSRSESESGLVHPPTNVEINIDAGVKVQGSRNVVCFGALFAPGARAGSGASGSKMQKSSSGQDPRKRRAQSVCMTFFFFPPLCLVFSDSEADFARSLLLVKGEGRGIGYDECGVNLEL